MQLQKSWHEKETTLAIDLRNIPSAMWPLVRSSPEWQAASKFVSAKWKRPLFESDEDDDDEDLKSSTTKLEWKRCQLDGNEEAAVSETKKCATAADVGRSQPLSQPDSLNDGSAVPKSASKKFVPLSAAVSAHVEKVVKIPKNKQWHGLKVSHRDSESGDESVNESRDDSDNNSEEGEKPSAIEKKTKQAKH